MKAAQLRQLEEMSDEEREEWRRAQRAQLEVIEPPTIAAARVRPTKEEWQARKAALRAAQEPEQAPEPVLINGEPMLETGPLLEAAHIPDQFEVEPVAPVPDDVVFADRRETERELYGTEPVAEEAAITVYDPEQREGINLGEPIEIAHLSGVEELEAHKENIVKYLKYGDVIMFSIAEELDIIREKELFRHDLNESTGKPYRSMAEYMPNLLEELKQRARLHKLSRRQVYEYLALRRVFVEQMNIPISEILEIGPSHFTEIREALDYDPKTGVVSKEPRAGKIGAETAQKLISEMREAAQAGQEVRVQDVRGALDAERGVQRRNVELEWVRNPDGKTFYLGRVKLWWDNDTLVEPLNRVTEEQARWLTKKWGSMSNLPPEA